MHDDEIEDARAAYYRSMKRQGYADVQIDTPSRHSDIVGNRVLLVGRGYLATYHLNSKRISHSRRDQVMIDGE